MKKYSISRALLCIGSICLAGFAFASQTAEAPIAIAIHGGAGTLSKANMSERQETEYKAVLARAVKAGYEQLKQGSSSLDAVVTSIKILEDSPLFNAGKGAVYTFDEEHELDASIMSGIDRQAGAVAGVKNVKNPILAALAVMRDSPHVMLSGSGAEAFALQQGLETVNNQYFDTDMRLEALRKAKAKILNSTKTSQVRPIDFWDYKFGTVGAVALDRNGNLAAGTSTGGMTAKRFGRIGDSPVIGAGTFADNQSCAVSATGHGEYFIRYNVASDICSRKLYMKLSLFEAAEQVINEVLVNVGGSGGVIALDAQGNIAMPFNTEGMYRASIDVNGQVSVEIYRTTK